MQRDEGRKSISNRIQSRHKSTKMAKDKTKEKKNEKRILILKKRIRAINSSLVCIGLLFGKVPLLIFCKHCSILFAFGTDLNETSIKQAIQKVQLCCSQFAAICINPCVCVLHCQ